MLSNQYDIIIIGAGPIGLACGIEAKKNNLKTLIIEAGCLVNSIYHYPKNMTFFSTSERLEIGNIPFISHGYKPTRSEAMEYYRRSMQYFSLKVNLYEKVSDIKNNNGLFEVVTGKQTYYASKVILATGFYSIPNLMNIPGEDLSKVKHYFDEPHPYTEMNVVVIGGGNSAVDAALEVFRRGAKVTMVVMTETLNPGIKYWVRPDIENRIKAGEIKGYFNSSVRAIYEDKVDLCTPSGEFSIKNDFVLAMTGYQPDYNLLNNAGVKICDDESKTPVYDPNTFETNVPGLFLAGCVCGGLNTSRWNIESARFHAEKIIQYILK